MTVYLDANIITSLIDFEEKTETVVHALDIFSQLDVELVTSDFTFTEVAKILIHTKKENPKKVAKILNGITISRQIRNYSFEIIPTSPDAGYSFEDFWVNVGENMNLYNPGWADAVHCVIMKNNGIKQILSTDEKDDFEIVPGLTLIHPKDVTI